MRIGEGDRQGLERLARYCARPAVSLERLSLLADGRVAYRIKWARRGGPTHRVMTPVEFLARLAALIPPPRHPLVRFHGVFAPNASWRKSVVPTHADPKPAVCDAGSSQLGASGTPQPARRTGANSAALADEPAKPKLDRAAVREDRGGRVAARLSRIDWATLLKRTYDVDVLACGACGGRLRFVAVITDPVTAREVLASLRLDTAAPPVARARGPDEWDFDAHSRGPPPRAGGTLVTDHADPPAPLD